MQSELRAEIPRGLSAMAIVWRGTASLSHDKGAGEWGRCVSASLIQTLAPALRICKSACGKIPGVLATISIQWAETNPALSAT